MRKQSEQLRQTIGHLLYEQQLAQIAGRDHQHELIQTQIDNARCNLKLVEESEKPCDNDPEDDQG
jgi:hypothetical protein